MRGGRGGEWRRLLTPSPQAYSEVKQGNGVHVPEEEQEKLHLYPRPLLSHLSLQQVVEESTKEWSGAKWNLVKIKNQSSLEAISQDGSLQLEGMSVKSRVFISRVLAEYWLSISWRKQHPFLPEPAPSLQLLQMRQPAPFPLALSSQNSCSTPGSSSPPTWEKSWLLWWKVEF